jgi:hypothetical protein
MLKLMGVPCLNLVATVQRVPGWSFFTMVKPHSLRSGSFTHRQADTDTSVSAIRTVQRAILPIWLHAIITRVPFALRGYILDYGAIACVILPVNPLGGTWFCVPAYQSTTQYLVPVHYSGNTTPVVFPLGATRLQCRIERQYRVKKGRILPYSETRIPLVVAHVVFLLSLRS